MKTLRNHWLDRHRRLDTQIDAIRIDALRRALPAASSSVPTAMVSAPGALWWTRVIRTLWGELVVPCRPAWATLAVVWAGLLLCDLTMSSSRSLPATAGASRPDIANAIACWMEQRRQMMALAQSISGNTLPTPPPSHNKHKPAASAPAASPDHSRWENPSAGSISRTICQTYRANVRSNAVPYMI